MRVGVVGLGWMGMVHLRIYGEMPGVQVVGAADVNPEARSAAEERFGVRPFDSLERLLDEGLDAVSVCVPTSLHHRVGLEVIGRGVAMLMEKPLASTVREGRQLVESANRANIPLMVGHVERFNPAVGRLRDILRESGDGQGEAVNVIIERVGPYPPRVKDVGVLKDLASHDIDLLRHLTGSEFRTVHCVVSRPGGGHEDAAMIAAEMQNGALGQICVNWLTPYKSRQIHVAARSRYLTADLITQQVKEYSNFTGYDSSYSVREWPVVYREPVREEMREFLAAVADGQPVPVPGEEGLRTLEIIERLERRFKARGKAGSRELSQARPRPAPAAKGREARP